MIFAQPNLEAILGQIGSIASHESCLVVQGIAGENPPRVRPPSAIMGSVGVTFAVSKLVMNAVGGYPEDRSPLERQRAADGEKVLQPLRRAVAAMGQQTVVPHPDAHVDGHHPKPEETEEGFPGKHEESNHSEHVESHHKAGGYPVRLVRLGVSSKHGYVAMWLHATRL